MTLNYAAFGDYCIWRIAVYREKIYSGIASQITDKIWFSFASIAKEVCIASFFLYSTKSEGYKLQSIILIDKVADIVGDDFGCKVIYYYLFVICNYSVRIFVALLWNAPCKLHRILCGFVVHL